VVRPSMCTPVTPAVPYLLLGLQDVPWAVGNSRGARKLARTPHVKKKKKSCVGAAPFLHRCRGIKGMTGWLFFFISTIIWHLSTFLIYRRWLILEFFYTYHFLLILFNMLIKLLMYILDFYIVNWKINIINIFLFF